MKQKALSDVMCKLFCDFQLFLPSDCNVLVQTYFIGQYKRIRRG